MANVTGDGFSIETYSKTARGNPDCRIMLDNVPARTGLCIGTGTVIVVPSVRFCMMR